MASCVFSGPTLLLSPEWAFGKGIDIDGMEALVA